jgi:putative membrane protein
VVLLQVLLVILSVLLVLQMQVVDIAALSLTLAVSALTFLIIVFALTRALGDAGKALSILFLAVQLSSSGGIIPVELSGGVFMDISPWLPLTWVVKAIKASMFGAFDHAWQFPLLLVAVSGLAATVMACTVGKWRYVEQASIRPSVNF